MIVDQSFFTLNSSDSCCSPGMEATSCLEGTSSMACGKSLYTYVDGKDRILDPSREETVSPSINLHGSCRETPCIVVVARVVGSISCL